MFKKFAKKISIYLLLVLSLIFILSCLFSGSSYGFFSKKKEVTPNIKIAIIFTSSGLGDKSFNDLAYDGMLMSQEKLGIEFDYAEPKYLEEYYELIRKYAENENYKLIIAISPEQEEALKKVSREFPNQKFTLIDSKLEQNNISSIYTSWTEQTFLNGVIAGLETRDIVEESVDEPLAGVVLGKDFPHLVEGAIGFEAGFRYVNNKGRVVVATINDFFNHSKARETSLLMYSKGVRYIQQIAGAAGLGVFSAAKEADRFAFGVDANQNFFEPDYIVSTATRYINEIIYKEIEAVKNNRWEDGVKFSGIKENIVNITTEESNVKLSKETIHIVDEIREEIVNGKLKVPLTEEELEEWIKFNKYED